MQIFGIERVGVGVKNFFTGKISIFSPLKDLAQKRLNFDPLELKTALKMGILKLNIIKICSFYALKLIIIKFAK